MPILTPTLFTKHNFLPKDKLERNILEGRDDMVIEKTCTLESEQVWNPGSFTKLSALGQVNEAFETSIPLTIKMAIIPTQPVGLCYILMCFEIEKYSLQAQEEGAEKAGASWKTSSWWRDLGLRLALHPGLDLCRVDGPISPQQTALASEWGRSGLALILSLGIKYSGRQVTLTWLLGGYRMKSQKLVVKRKCVMLSCGDNLMRSSPQERHSCP